MKKILLHLALLLAVAALKGQNTNWVSVNQGQTVCINFQAVTAAGLNRLITIGGSSIYESIDGGATWQETFNTGSGTFYDIECPDPNTCFATSSNGIWKYQSGNNSWTKIPNSPSVRDISCAGPDSAAALSTNNKLYWTVDGANSLTDMAFNVSMSLSAIHAINGKNAVVAANLSQDGMLLKYQMVSNSWIPVNTIANRYLRALHFPTPQVGYAVGTNGILLKTTNGGNSWTIKNLIPGLELKSVHFVDSQRGFTGAASGEIFITFDGGNTWAAVNSGVQRLNDIFSTDGFRVIAVGNDGQIAVSNNSGMTWNAAVTGGTAICADLRSVYFTGENVGYVGGTAGRLYKTPDGGANWDQLFLPGNSSTVYAVFFPSENIGFAAGDGFQIFKTKDKGASWYATSVNGDSGPIHDLHFSTGNTQTGYATMAGGGMLKSVDGGENWFQLDYITSNCLLGVHFVAPQKGWVVGADGFIALTKDGGSTWNVQNSNTFNTLEDVFFLNDNLGWAAGDNVILRTTDGGSQWDTVYTGDEFFNHIHFTDALQGWTVGDFGVILHSSDGGITWANDQNLNIPYNLWGVHFPTPGAGYIAGTRTVLKSDLGVDLNIDSVWLSSGNTVLVPVTARKFKDISSFQGTVHLGNPADFTLVSIKNAALTNIYTFALQLPEQGRRFIWYSPAGCQTFPDGAILFYVEVKLTGQAGACTSIYIDGSPMPLKIYRCDGNSFSSVPVNCDPGAVCSAAEVQISGKITLTDGQGVNAEVTDTQSPSQTVTGTVTDAAGAYEFSGLNSGEDHLIQPSKSGITTGCIDVMDVLILYNILINGQPFASIDQQIASDLDGNGLVDIVDMFMLQDHIGAGTPFSIGKTWRFRPVKSSLPFNPGAFTVPAFAEYYQLLHLVSDTTGLDYVAVPLGNLFGGDCLMNPPVDSRSKPLNFWVEKEYHESEGIVLFHVKTNELAGVAAFQMMPVFDMEQMEFLRFRPGCLTAWSEGIIPLPEAVNGRIPVFWYGSNQKQPCISTEDSETLFTLVFRLSENSGQTKHTLDLSASQFEPKAYNAAGQSMGINLTEKPSSFNIPRLFQNRPNPFNGKTTIGYFLPESVECGEILVTDVAGREIARIPLAESGESSVTFEAKGLSAGLCFYTLLADGKIVDTKRMILE